MSLHLLSMTQTALNAGFTQVGIWTAVVVLACIFGAEIACISILISKMLRAKKQRREEEYEDSYSSNRSNRNYAGMLFLVGAIPQMTYTALGVLAVLVAVGALLFALLLIIFLAKGYDCVPASLIKKETPAQPKTPPVESRPVEVPALVEEEALGVFAEVPPAPVETVEDEPAVEETTDEEEEAPLYADLTAPVETLPASIETTPSAKVAPAPVAAEREPTFADGSRPYKVVEKVVTETYKEIIKETPVPTAQPTPAAETTDANGAILEKLSDFLDYELQKRKAEESADESKEDEDKLVTVLAEDELEDMDAEEDADDEEESSEEKDADDEERDDEENDTEGDHFTGNERIIGFDEETGCYIVAHYRKSFEAKLIQARPNIKKYYSELKNALLSYKGTKDRVSWNMDSFHNGRTPIAKINVKTRILELYLALDPETLEGTVYRGKNVGDKKKYIDTPFRYKLRTPRKFQWAMELVQRTCEEHGLSPIDIEPVDYAELYPFDTTENLVERKLIKEYIRQEKPATTFELSADHVPEVPEEDGSVIPANANFSWELDNEKLHEEEPAPVEIEEESVEEEPVVVEEPVEEPVEEVPAAPVAEPVVARETVRETVKVTEMRYTERYYADPNPTYERIVTTEEPLIEAVAVSADAEPMPEETVPVATYTEVETTEESVKEIAEEIPEEPTEEILTEEAEEIPEETAGDALFAEVDPFAAYRDEEPAEAGDEPIEEEPIEEEPIEEELIEEELIEEEPIEEESIEEEPIEEELIEEETYEEETYEEVAPAEEEVISTYTVKAMGSVEEEPTEEPVEEAPQSEAQPRIKIKTDPTVAIIDISSVQYDFSDGDTVNLTTLRELGLVHNAAYRLKVYTTGPVEKPLNVEADHLTLDAIKAISDANGTIAITQ